MSRKIMAIGGGENGGLRGDGTRKPYETGPMDREIVRLAEKEHPHFLFLGHAVPPEVQEGYFQTMKSVYEKLGCSCRDLKSRDLSEKDRIRSLVEWADIIYEGGGNTLDMIALWKDSGLDVLLRDAWDRGTVLCGVSAGANCWFRKCSSDSLQIKYGEDQPLIGMDCLGFAEGFFVPHCDEPGRQESVKELLKEDGGTGILVSNCCALEIVDDRYRLLVSDGSRYQIRPYAQKAFWQGNQYLESPLDDTPEWKPLEDLQSRENRHF